MYFVLSCGVNYGPGAPLLSFAEKDAVDIWNVFDSALGPPEVMGGCLLGAQAKRPGIFQILAALAVNPPERLLLYFSGHGSEQGILLADGLLRYQELADLLRRVRARSIMVILDTCHAAAYGRFVPEENVAGVGSLNEDLAWLQVLAAAHPGMRMLFATGAQTLSREDPSAKNGYFTAALLHALQHSTGNIHFGNSRFVSDRDAFVNAAAFMQEQQTKNRQQPGSPRRREAFQEPQYLGNLGDFPLVLSQADRAVGTAQITQITPTRGISTEVDFLIRGRKNIPTQWHTQLTRANGSRLASQSRTVLPDTDEYVLRNKVQFPVSVLNDDPISSFTLETGGLLPVRWIFELLDQHGHVLARRTLDRSYYKESNQPQRGY